MSKPLDVCNEEVPLSERGFDEVIEGFENGAENKHLLTLFLELSVRNVSVVLIGDSINNQMADALKLELDRHNAGTFSSDLGASVWWLEPTFLRKFGMDASDLHLHGRQKQSWISVTTWTPYNHINYNAKSYPVYIYTLNLWIYGHHLQSFRTLKLFMPFLLTHVHPAGTFLLANIGHHIENERVTYLDGNKQPLFALMNAFLLLLEDLLLTNKNNIVAFRETTPAHFDTGEHRNGFYESYVKSDAFKTFNWSLANSWDNTHFHCRETMQFQDLHDFQSIQTSENAVVERLLYGWKHRGIFSYIDRLPVFKYLVHFHKLKAGTCHERSTFSIHTKRYVDCLHFIANHPPLWAPVWKEMLLLFQRQIEWRHRNATQLAEEYGNFNVSWNGDHQWSAAELVSYQHSTDSSMLTNRGTSIGTSTNDYYLLRGALLHPVLSSVYEQLFHEDLTTVSARSLSTIEFTNAIISFPVSIVPVNKIMMFEDGHGLITPDGKLFMIRNRAELIELLRNMGNKQKTLVAQEVLSPEIIDIIPLYRPIVNNNTVIRLINANVISCYLFIDSVLRLISDVGNIEACKKLDPDAVQPTLQTAAQEYDHHSRDSSLDCREGHHQQGSQQGPGLSSPATCTLTSDYFNMLTIAAPLPIANETLLLHKKAAYYYVNGQVRWIPDMDTFYSLKLSMEKGLHISEQDYKQLKIGPDWPKCKNC